MARKKRAPKVPPVVAAKQAKLEELREFLRDQGKEYEANLNAQCKVICESIRKTYMDHLNAIPEELRNMTISEIMDRQLKVTQAQEDGDEDFLKQCQSHAERNRLVSEKKKTNKMSRLERKRSLSVSTCSSYKTVNSDRNPLRPMSRVLSDTNLNTPLSKRSAAPAYAVTPKFNPKSVVNKNLLRKPRAGEVVMSLSGSPLLNILDDIAGKPGLTVSLGFGKVVNIAEEKELEKLQLDLAKLDESAKHTLQCAKEKLVKILQSD